MKSSVPQYRFGPFVLIPSEHVVLRDGKPLHLTRKDFELLVAFVERSGQLLRKEELQRRLWPATVVEDGNLNKHVSTLRKALGDVEGGDRLIESVPRVGFRFTAPVERIDDANAAPARVTGGRPRGALLLASAAMVAAISLAVGFARMGDRVKPNGTGTWTAFAVLPFTTLGGEESDRLGLGLADGIITRLSGQTLLPVRPTSAVRRYTGTTRPDAAAVARELDVDVVLEGHIQRDGKNVRVTVQLTDVRAASPVWAETFDQPVVELFRLEDAIASRVARALRLRLAAAEQERLKRRYTSNAAAYDAYLEGRDELLRYTPASTRRAITAFERALALDPAYTLARAGLAMASAEMFLRFAPELEVQQWGERAERESLSALDLDPDLAEAHLARAAVFRKREFDWAETIAASRRALLLNPNLNQAHFFTAAALYHMGQMEPALAAMERGRAIGGGDIVEPLRIEGLVALFSANFPVARERLEEVSRQSSRAIGDTYLALAYYYSGDGPRARTMLEQLSAEPSASTSTRSRAALAGVLGAAGDSLSARRLLDAVINGTYRDHHVSYSVGAAFAQLGDTAQAVDWLRKAADTGFPCAVWYSRDPLLDPLRKDRSFAALISDLSMRVKE